MYFDFMTVVKKKLVWSAGVVTTLLPLLPGWLWLRMVNSSQPDETPPNECPEYNIKQSDREAPVMLEL